MEKKNTITTMIVLVIILGLVATIVLLVIDNRQKQAQLDAIASERVNAADAAEADSGETSPTEGESESGTGSDAEMLCTQEFLSEKGITVRLRDWTAGKTISSPVTITGEIPGSWSFEGGFPVVLVNWDG
jgi:type II secretory pathway pseudopilin PulG